MAKKIFFGVILVLTFMSGCGMKNEVEKRPAEETITTHDIEIYQRLKDSCCSMDRHREEARDALRATFAKIEAIKEDSKSREESSNRFDAVVRGYLNEQKN